MPSLTDQDIIELLRQRAEPWIGATQDYDRVSDLVGRARFVLLGEASHGTHEFYRERAEITKRLITEKGFRAVAVEADWPDAYRVNRYVRGDSEDDDAVEALSGFRRFPTWMWRNTAVVEFVAWLRAHNDALEPGEPKVGFYGLDLYSLRASMERVLGYLDRIDPDAARQARARYACFDQFRENAQNYGLLTGLGLAKSCEEEVVSELVDLQRRAADYARRRPADNALFDALQNARVVKNAETYYRAMFHEEASTWNLRDRHMAETLGELAAHLSWDGGALVGFTTYHGAGGCTADVRGTEPRRVETLQTPGDRA